MLTTSDTDIYSELQTLMRNCAPKKDGSGKITDENVSLDDIEKNISGILTGLNRHVKKLHKKDSFSDVNVQLEQNFQKTNKIQREKCEHEQKSENKKPQSSKNPKQTLNKPKNNQNLPKIVKKPKIDNVQSKTSDKTRTPPKAPARPESPLPRPKQSLDLLKNQVDAAIRQSKTFSIHGNYPAVRRALINRGWIEKIRPSTQNADLNKLKMFSIEELNNLMQSNHSVDICKRLIQSKLLTGHQVALHWTWTADPFRETTEFSHKTLINRLKRSGPSYTSKQGLCSVAKEAHWFNMPPVAKINLPRTYPLTKDGETDDFVADFRLTAAMSLVKWMARHVGSRDSPVTSSNGKVPLKVFDFALNECYKHIKRCNHDDLDMEIANASQREWNEFLEAFYNVVHFGHHFRSEGGCDEDVLLRKSEFILKKLDRCSRYLQMDGFMNIWILKPMNSSQGQGIHVCRTMKYIMNVVKNNPNRNYIVQKYIERPLLIFNTKFDIRQWFLISCCKPLTIWMYKDCYLRFSSQTYNLRKLHESIHLTNNSVQSKYTNKSRDIALPSYNMWDSTEFQNYLTKIGHPTAWSTAIYKGMKECITAAVLMHQDKLKIRTNCFELYGADFLLTEDLKPFLLEINASPALYASTPVTARMCPKVLEDVIKVVIDHARRPNANTGQFELLYREKTEKLPSINDFKLEIVGRPLKNNYFYNGKQENVDQRLVSKENSTQLVVTNEFKEIKENLITVTEDIKFTLRNLLNLVRLEKERRRNTKNEYVQIKFNT